MLAPDIKEYPFWWDAARFLKPGRAVPDELSPVPQTADVVVIGAGLTGVSAARELAAAGRDVMVLDSWEPGEGASSRNAGMLGRNFKHSFVGLTETLGLDTAKAYFSELQEIYEAAVRRIRDETIDCDFRTCGRFVGALSPAHHEKLIKEYEARAHHLGDKIEFIPASQRIEIGSEMFYGGVHIVDNASIQPARHFEALRRRAAEAGARIIGHTPVTTVTREGKDFITHVGRGRVRSRDVVIATNGYTSHAMPWFARRLSPIHAYMIATEELSPDLAKSVSPNHRTYHDNRRSSNYMQLSPDGRRLLFGGRTGLRHRSLKELALRLGREMKVLFPQLADVKISHVWTGRCAATPDMFPHVGVHDGMHYALGYCFSGNAMAPFLGIKAARRLMNAPDSSTIFGTRPLPEMPWAARQDWLMPAVMHVWRWRDRPVSRAA